jgi:hypothetical protein
LPIDKLFNLSELNRAVMPLSEYSGSKKPEMSLEIESDKKAISKTTGFEGFVFNANLREQPDESITIIDTEKASFKDHEVDGFSLLSS